MASRYSGPAFPLRRDLKNGSPEFLLECMHRALNGDLRIDLAKRADEIRAKGTAGVLGPVGVQQDLRKLRNEYEEIITTRGWGHEAADNWNEFLGKARKRVADLTAKLTAPPETAKSKDMDEAVERANRRDRTIQRYERREPAEQRAAVAAAREKLRGGDSVAREFLIALLNEPGLLDAQTAQRVEADLMANQDPAAYRELEEFLGRMVNGERDPITGALPVVEFAMAKFREYADELCNTDSAVEAARAKLMKQIEANPTAPVTLTAEQAHDARLYQLAKSVAAEHGRVLSIEGDQGTGDLNPVNGAGS